MFFFLALTSLDLIIQIYLRDRSVNLPPGSELSAKAICCHVHSLVNSVYLDLEDYPPFTEEESCGPHPPSLSKSLAPPSHHGWSAHYEWSQVSLPDGEITLRPDITQALLALMPHTPHIIWSLFSLPDRLGNLPTPHTHVLRPQDCFTITIQTRFTDLLISKTLTIHSSIDKIYCVDNF